jgi:hypothetical protein
MATSLYDLSVGAYIQAVSGVAGVLDRGLAHFTDNGVQPDEVLDFRLFPDMLPFRFQVQSVEYHSIGAIKALKDGVFKPPMTMPPHSYADLQALMADTLTALKAQTPDEINALEGGDMALAFGDHRIPFTPANFVMSFSTFNVLFHAATTYDILRVKGVPLGKRDFMGAMRVGAA